MDLWKVYGLLLRILTTFWTVLCQYKHVNYVFFCKVALVLDLAATKDVSLAYHCRWLVSGLM